MQKLHTEREKNATLESLLAYKTGQRTRSQKTLGRIFPMMASYSLQQHW